MGGWEEGAGGRKESRGRRQRNRRRRRKRGKKRRRMRGRKRRRMGDRRRWGGGGGRSFWFKPLISQRLPCRAMSMLRNKTSLQLLL